MRYLLDTNTCIAVMRSHPIAVQRTSARSPQEIAVSTVTIYELCTGVAKCAQPAVERAKVEMLLYAIEVLPLHTDAAHEAARIRAHLESQGEMIGPYDVLIAGQAVAAGLVLVTNNTHEFRRVPGLPIEDWQV